MTPVPSPRHARSTPAPSETAPSSLDAPASDSAPATPVDDTPSHMPKKGLAVASAIMAAGTLVSRGLGFVRTALLAIAIGSTSLIADVFEKANSIPNVIYVLLAGGIFNVVLVPQLIKAAKQPDRGADYTSRLLTLAVIIMGIATLLLTLAAYPIIQMLTLNWTEPMLALGTAFALWTLPQIFFYGLYAVVGQILNANAKFGWFMWAPVLNNIVAIGFIIGFIITFGSYSSEDNQAVEWTSTQTMWLAGAHTLGIILQAAILLWPLSKLGIPLRPKFGIRGMGLGATGRIAAWTLGAMTIGNVSNLLHMRLISGATASREEMETGGAAIPGEYAANVAELIVLLPHSVFVLSIATVLFNQLSRAMDLGQYDDARALINRGLRMFAIPVMFFTVAMVVLAGPLGRLFGGASSDAHLSGAAIGQLLVLYAVALPFRSANFYMMRAFYAAEDARTPMMVYGICAGFSLVVAYGGAAVIPNEFLPYYIVGLFGLMNAVQFVFWHVLVVRRWGGYGFASVLQTYTKTGFAALAAGAAGAVVLVPLGTFSWGFAWNSIITAFVTCAIAAVVMALVFAVALHLLRVQEFREFLAPIARRLPGLKRLVE